MNIVLNYFKRWKLDQHSIKTSSDIQELIKSNPELNIQQVQLKLLSLDNYLNENSTDILFIYGCGNNKSDVEDIAKLRKKHKNVKIILHLDDPKPALLLKCIDLRLNDIITHNDTQTIIKEIVEYRTAQESYLKDKTHSRQVFGFMSAKGGDGSTVVATNFAAALSRDSKKRVVVIDMSIPFGDADMYLTQHQNIFDLADFINSYDRLDEVLVESMTQKLKTNFHFIPAAKDYQKVMEMDIANYEQIVNKLKDFYDYIVLDFSSNFDPVLLNAARSCDQIFMVLSNNLASIRLCTQKINVLQQNKIAAEKIVMIENEATVNKEISVGHIEIALDKKIDLSIPHDNDIINESLIQSKPAVNIDSSNKISKKIISFSQKWLGNHSNTTKVKTSWGNWFK